MEPMSPRRDQGHCNARMAFITLAAVNVVLLFTLISQHVLGKQRLAGGTQACAQVISRSLTPGRRSSRNKLDSILLSGSEKIDCPPLNITVNYNAYIWPDQDWKFLIGSQMGDLAKSGLHHCANVVIAVSIPEQHNNHTYLELQDILQEALIFIRDLEAGSQATVIQEHENAYEYPGIHSLYRIANSEEDDAVAHNHLLLYFHTKGMVRHGILKERIDRSLFDATIVPWRSIAQQFLVHDDIRAVAWMPSLGGWGWYNFWWVRGDFVKKLQEPRRDVERHWFESWLGNTTAEAKNGTKVLSTCTCDFMKVDPHEIQYAMKQCVPVTQDTCLPESSR